MGMIFEEKCNVMAAHKDGALIQFREHGSEIWEDTNTPLWNFAAYDYRVKPDLSNQGLKIPESIEDQQKMVREFLEECKTPVFEYILKWIEDNTQEIESFGYVKEDNITYDYVKDNHPDLIQEILSTEPADPGNMTDDEVEECARYWMSRASSEEIIDMIKDEA